MVALQRPYDTITAEQFKERVCVNQQRPKLNERKWPGVICTLLAACWHHQPSERPDSSKVR